MPRRAKEVEQQMGNALIAILEHQGIVQDRGEVDDGETFFTLTDEHGRAIFIVQLLVFDLREDAQDWQLHEPDEELNE